MCSVHRENPFRSNRTYSQIGARHSPFKLKVDALPVNEVVVSGQPSQSRCPGDWQRLIQGYERAEMMLIYLCRAAEGAEATPPQPSDSDAPKPHRMHRKHSSLTIISVHQDALNPKFPRTIQETSLFTLCQSRKVLSLFASS